MSPHNFYVKLKLLNVTGISTILKFLSVCNEIALAVKGQEESDSVLGFDVRSSCLFIWMAWITLI